MAAHLHRGSAKPVDTARDPPPCPADGRTLGCAGRDLIADRSLQPLVVSVSTQLSRRFAILADPPDGRSPIYWPELHASSLTAELAAHRCDGGARPFVIGKNLPPPL